MGGNSAALEAALAVGGSTEETDDVRMTLPQISIPACVILSYYNILMQYGLTGLHWAAYRGHTEGVRILLAAGADANAKSSVRTLGFQSCGVAVLR